MEAYYMLIVGVLFLLAISDLIVGVSNDAVNFLNSAIGSKAAPFKIILAIAAVGVLVGAVFSNGMMEVARKGIFNPEHFAFSEIMVIFLAPATGLFQHCRITYIYNGIYCVRDTWIGSGCFSI